jgi:hypothetical protein
MFMFKAFTFFDRIGSLVINARVFAFCAACSLLMPASLCHAGQLSVIELFTSQGCSSCPPADRLLGELAKRPEIIALSLPVDYWDYIGWKDTLASPRFSARQKAYAALLDTHKVYTPQAVVNGVAEAVGSDRDELEQAISASKTAQIEGVPPILLSDLNGSLKIDIPAGAGFPANVMIMRVAHKTMVKIGRGENAGNAVTYTNVVRAMHTLGEWEGKPKSFVIPKIVGDGEGYVVLLQKGGPDLPGPILAAAKTPEL